MSMKFSRCLAAVACLLIAVIPARAALFRADISLRIYSLNAKGDLRFQAGGNKHFIDLAIEQNPSLNLVANELALVYDTDANGGVGAIEVVRKADGSLITTVMTFVNDTEVENAPADTHAFRQTFLTLSGTAAVTGTASVSGTETINGSAAGPVHIAYDHHDNIIAYRWNGDFQYSIPGSTDTLNSIVVGHFVLGRELRIK